MLLQFAALHLLTTQVISGNWPFNKKLQYLYKFYLFCDSLDRFLTKSIRAQLKKLTGSLMNHTVLFPGNGGAQFMHFIRSEVSKL